MSQDRIGDRGLGGPRPRWAAARSRSAGKVEDLGRWSVVGVVDRSLQPVPGPVDNTPSLELVNGIACSGTGFWS